MAITRSELQVTWSAASSLAIAALGNGTSDNMSLDATCSAAAITLKANNDGTAGAGDTVDFYLAATAGDPDGASTDEYPSVVENMHYLGTIDTSDTNPGVLTVEMPVVPQKFRIYAKAWATGDQVTVSATVEELRVA